MEPDISSYRLCKIVGMGSAKNALLEAILLPLCMGESYSTAQRYCGVLLFGCSGVGKSSIVRAVVNEGKILYRLNIKFIPLKVGDLVGSLMGETEKNLSDVFTQARLNQPSVILIDEIDGIMRSRSSDERECHRNIKNHLLCLMDDLINGCHNVVVVGTTNKIDDIDEAFRRRFDKRAYIKLPTASERCEIIYGALKSIRGANIDWKSIKFAEIAELTNKFSPADLQNLVKVAYHHSCGASTLNHLKKEIFYKKVVKFNSETNRRVLGHVHLVATAMELVATTPNDVVEKMDEFARLYTNCKNQDKACTPEPTGGCCQVKSFKDFFSGLCCFFTRRNL